MPDDGWVGFGSTGNFAVDVDALRHVQIASMWVYGGITMQIGSIQKVGTSLQRFFVSLTLLYGPLVIKIGELET